MVTSINLSSVGGSLNISLTDWSASQLILTNVEGISPVPANINITQYASADGGIFNSSRRSERNIVITAKLGNKPNMDSVREKVYNVCRTGEPINVSVYFSGTSVKRTEGFVESVEADYFGNAECIQISIICPNPDWS